MYHPNKSSLPVGYKIAGKLCIALICCNLLSQKIKAQADWQKITSPTIAQLSNNLSSPPSQNSITVTWGWDGNMSREVVARDLDKLFSVGFRAVTIEPGYGMAGKYLSDAWFQSIKVAVEEAKKRGMHIWIIDEGKYPSGFAGGKFSEERPDLKMQALTLAQRIHTTGGQVTDQTVSADALAAVAFNTDDKTSLPINISSGKLHFVAPPGNWDIVVVQHQFRTSPTRSANNPTKGKDGSASLMDYLNPEATKQFLTWTEEQYKKYIGDEFGKTLLGFRGDEPAFSYTPWTPALPEVFKAKKGYDIMPYLASFFIQNPTPEQTRAKADFYDVWSDLFGQSYFKQEGDWCKANGIEYMVHLDKDDNMGQFVRSGGDFFKDMKDVQIPGVDAIWHQIWSDTVSNFPKFASSVSHIYNKPRALSETFAAYRPAPNDEQAKWVLNQEMVRGINLFELMFVSSSSRSGQTNLRGYMAEAAFPDLVKYTNNACYLLAQGRPATQVAFYLPTTSLFMGDMNANKSLIHIGEQLLDTQHDFDFVSDEALSTDLKLANGQFVTAGGTAYSTVVLPSISVISQTVLGRLKEFASKGGHVVFIGNTPSLISGKTVLNGRPSTASDFSWAYVEPSGELTAAAVDKMTVSDVLFSAHPTATSPAPNVKYVHRELKDADVYFFFNESVTKDVETTAVVKGAGKTKIWNPQTAELTDDASSGSIDDAKSRTVFTLKLKPQETKFYIISKAKM